MKLDRQVTESTRACVAALHDGSAMACAARAQELLEAESLGLISKSWRQSIDVAGAQAFIRTHQAEARAQWAADLAHLRSVLDFGGRLEYEEAMLVLTLRSELELAAKQIDVVGAGSLVDADALLSEALSENRSVVLQCRRKKSLGLAASLPSHWWWRTDEP